MEGPNEGTALDETRLCLFVPCYNAGRFLGDTVSRIPWAALPSELEYSLLFVDNASGDDTWEVIGRLRSGLPVESGAIRHPVNRHYGGSVKSAFAHCLENGIGLIAVVHADGQYAPEELPRLIRELQRHPDSALHFGSRLAGAPLRGGMPLYKWVGNHALTAIQNRVLGTHLSEFHSGYRLYRLGSVATTRWREASDGFVFDNEIIFLLVNAGFGITESPIPTFYGEEISHVPKIGTPLAILRNTWRFFRAVRRGRPDPLYAEA